MAWQAFLVSAARTGADTIAIKVEFRLDTVPSHTKDYAFGPASGPLTREGFESMVKKDLTILARQDTVVAVVNANAGAEIIP